MNRTTKPPQPRKISARRMASAALFPLALLMLPTEPASAGAPEPVLPEALQADLAILEQALAALHPGLDRYAGRPAIDAAFAELKEKAKAQLTLPQAYLELSRFLATIRCGHTYANFWNQPEEVQRSLFGGADKVPFTFRLIDGRMLVESSATSSPKIRRGVEILSLDGVEVSTVLERLMPFLSADGGNEGQRRRLLELSGVGEFEHFDIFFPLVFPPQEEGLRIEARGVEGGAEATFSVVELRLDRARRAEVIAAAAGMPERSPDDSWRFEIFDHPTGPIGYLQLGTFVTWKMDLDWKAFLAESFAQLEGTSTADLILDLRGNAGGDDAVNSALLRYLVTRPIQTEAGRQLLRYDKVPADLAPYLDTWDASIKDLTRKVEPAGDGFFQQRGMRVDGRNLRPTEDAYQGRVYVLIDAANSSATFILSRLLQANGLATLVGQESGGNLRGTNGGQMFFLRLPNSGLEVDLPLIGWFPKEEQPDGGLRPDVLVELDATDFVAEIDRVLERAKDLIDAARAAPQ